MLAVVTSQLVKLRSQHGLFLRLRKAVLRCREKVGKVHGRPVSF